MVTHAVSRRRGFTLIELLVVVTIVILVSVVALPTVLPAINHRQVSEAARILQGALVGARDKAIHDGRPSGIRLLPDLSFNGVNPVTGLVHPAFALAYNRIVPIDPAPEYNEGFVTVRPGTPYGPGITGGVPCLVLEEAPLDKNGAPNPPTSWSWNIRVGDKVQLNGAGPWYTVIGPMQIGPGRAVASGNAGNSEMFINVGQPGATSPLNPSGNLPVEFLLLVNGQDDNQNGWIDEGWDGVDNDGNGQIDETTSAANSQGEWAESERWLGAAPAGMTSVSYTIRRRPLPAPGAREIALPTGMVIDASTAMMATRERSRLPVNPYTGAVEILVNPDGTAAYSSPYGTPSSFGMADAFYHFWLASREDVVGPPLQRDAAGNVLQPPVAVPLETVGGKPHYLPVARPGGASAAYSLPVLEGGYSLLTLSGRTGQMVTVEAPAFDDPVAPANGVGYDVGLPFRASQQGVR